MKEVSTSPIQTSVAIARTLLTTLILFCIPITVANADTNLVGNAKAGSEIYNAVCKGCHGVSIAPSLRGIIDRPIASTDFAGYSDGLKAKKELKWTVENLNTFLTAPLEFAPGTLMVQAIAEDQKRADIIAFLAKLPPPRK